MKTLILTFILTLSSQLSYAYEIKCHNKKENMQLNIQYVGGALALATYIGGIGTRGNTMGYYSLTSTHYKTETKNIPRTMKKYYFKSTKMIFDKAYSKDGKALVYGPFPPEKFHFLSIEKSDGNPRGSRSTKYQLEIEKNTYNLNCYY